MSGVDLEKVGDDFLAFAWENLSPRDRAKVMAGSPKTAWIFGAGASHHYDLNVRGVPVPLASGFFNAFHELPTSEGFHAHVGPFISFLQHYRDVKILEVSQWTENVEDFMTSVESELIELRKKIKKQDLGKKDLLKSVSLCAVFNNMIFIFVNVEKKWGQIFILDFAIISSSIRCGLARPRSLIGGKPTQVAVSHGCGFENDRVSCGVRHR